MSKLKEGRMKSSGRWTLAGLLCAFVLGSCNREAPPPPAPIDIQPVAIGEELGGFYRERGFKPLWFAGRTIKPEVQLVISKIDQAALHGLDPARYQPDRLRSAIEAARGRDPKAVAQAELLISKAYTEYVRDLRRGPDKASMLYVDEALRPSRPSAAALIARLAESNSFAAQVRADLVVNPLYDRLATGFAGYFKRWGALPQIKVASAADLRPGMSGEQVQALRRRLGLPIGEGLYDDQLMKAVRGFEDVHGLIADGVADEATLAALNQGYRHFEGIIQANLDRARALPSTSGRFVLVDTAGARLWLFNEGRAVDSMRVIVGKEAMATPDMAALIRFAALNPYWNVPPDLIRTSVAQKVLKQGVGYLKGQRLQVLSDWSPQARVLEPSKVDWRAVAAGRRLVQVRQLPGPVNMMGNVKFMFPNKLGIYLHDTPDKSFFAAEQRRFSSGCVRVEDAERLSTWLFEGDAPVPSGVAEQRVNLPRPVPVFITYLTAVPAAGGIRFQSDVYRRDSNPDQLSAR